MGNTVKSPSLSSASFKTIPPEDIWLQNQTFRIQDHSYTLVHRIGGGTFGSVWASSTEEGYPAAVKIFDLNRFRNGINAGGLLASFRHEVGMLYRMRSETQHVVTIYGFDYAVNRRTALLAMELGGESLDERVKTLHQINLGSLRTGDEFIKAQDRKNIWIQLVNIVLVLGQYNIVHRDLKPSNLVFFGPILKVIDLGIAQKEMSKYEHRRVIGAGTRFFSAPECLSNQYLVTSKADIWSIGAILYYLTYGIPPIYESSHPPPGVPQTNSQLVQNILEHCLQRDPNRRPTHEWLVMHPYTNSTTLI